MISSLMICRQTQLSLMVSRISDTNCYGLKVTSEVLSIYIINELIRFSVNPLQGKRLLVTEKSVIICL